MHRYRKFQGDISSWRSWAKWARIFKLFRTPSIDSTELIPYNLSPISESEFLNFYGAQESIPRDQFRQSRYDNAIPTRFLARIDCLKFQHCSHRPVSSKCPISEFFEGISQFTVWARVNICYRFHTWSLLNSRSWFSPLTRLKILPLYSYSFNIRGEWVREKTGS